MQDFLCLVTLLALVGLVVWAGKKGFTRKSSCGGPGVCCGIARRLDLPENAVKIITVIVTVFTGGIALLLYVFAWLCWKAE